MSKENVELVRSIQPDGADLVDVFSGREALERPFGSDADPDVFASDLDVRFLSRLPEGPQISYTGLAGLLEGWQEWLGPWASYRIRVDDLLDAGDNVVALVHITGRTTRDDVQVAHTAAAVWCFQEGRIVKLHFYLERDDALRAAGLASQGTVRRTTQ